MPGLKSTYGVSKTQKSYEPADADLPSEHEGRVRNVVLGLKDLAAYQASGWWNCLIGRYANRLKNGVTLEGKHYPLVQDANGITLHGGSAPSAC